MPEPVQQKGGQSVLGRYIDHGETYGSHVIEKMIRNIDEIELAVDIGAGEGRDLSLIKSLHPTCRTVAIEASRQMADRLEAEGHEVVLLNIENQPLPFADGSVDLIIANQVMEHTKEIFWIFHEIARSLRPGGHFIMGTPNILSFHNRIGALTGMHPTQHKLASAHVRPFSRRDTARFLETCSPGTFSMNGFAGSQFYPFPRAVSRALSAMFPNASFSIFMDLVKVGAYDRQFLDFPSNAVLETNFYTGTDTATRWGTSSSQQ